MRVKRAAVVLSVLLGSFAGSQAAAQRTEPAGLYFHRFTGTFNGSEWSTFGAIDGTNRYEFSDLTSEGTFPLTYADDNTFVLDRGQGTGAMSDADTGRIEFTITGGFNFTSELRRAPYTDTSFPVFNNGGVAGDAGLTGEWAGFVRTVNPQTGVTVREVPQNVDVAVVGDTVSLTLEDGSAHTGVWQSADQAGFRVVDGFVRDPDYRTWAGSTTSSGRNLVGDLRVREDGSISAALFFQTRAPLGSQVQTMSYLELRRVPTPTGAALFVGAGLVAARRRR